MLNFSAKQKISDMKNRVLDLFEYAKKVDAFSPKKPTEAKNNQIKLKGIRLPSLEFNLIKKNLKSSTALPMKNPKKMTFEDCDSKRVSFIKSAYSAYKCCQNQDLHLFQHKKIYLEKCFCLKGVVGWRLPKKKLVQQRLRSLVDGLKFNSDTYKSHLITWILKLKKTEEEEKSMQAQLELQKQRKEKQTYLNSKPIF
jgi:hypothetical protein